MDRLGIGVHRPISVGDVVVSRWTGVWGNWSRIRGSFGIHLWLWPYTPEYTGSRPISEVKLVLAQLVLGWGTTWEYCVL